LRGLEPGSFYVLGVIDIPPDDPIIPGATDLSVTAPLVTLVDRDLSIVVNLDSDGGV
jgi:hypothetical protein